MSDELLISFVICTRNRCDVLVETLRQLAGCGLPADAFEVHVIDDASTDGTSGAVLREFPQVKLYRQRVSRGPVSKNLALAAARGRYIVFLDDDSYPLGDSVRQMVRYFQADPMLGAAVFSVLLADGSQECSAYPNVFIGCGVGFRRTALDQAGGLPADYFMQAEEYDLSLRLMDGGWGVERFEDLKVRHLKSPRARCAARVMRLDVRNNLTLIMRRFPLRRVLPFAWDWMGRYWQIAKANGQRTAFVRGVMEGMWRAFDVKARHAVSEPTFELFARIEETKDQLARQRHDKAFESVIFVDLGKNVLAYWQAAQACGVRVVAIADNRLAGGTYRGIPVVTDEMARGMKFDAAIISNLSPVHARRRAAEWRRDDARPVIDLFEQADAGDMQLGMAA